MLSRAIHNVKTSFEAEYAAGRTHGEKMQESLIEILAMWHLMAIKLEDRVEDLEVSLAGSNDNAARGNFGRRSNAVFLAEKAQRPTDQNRSDTATRPVRFSDKHHGFKRLECVVDNTKGGQS